MSSSVGDKFPDPVDPGVWWRGNSRWIRYGSLVEKAILEATATGKETLTMPLRKGDGDGDGDETRYKLYLRQLKQVNMRTRYEREMRINKKKPISNTNNVFQASDDVASTTKGQENSVSEKLVVPRHILINTMGETKGMSAWLDGLLQSEKLVLQFVKSRCSHNITEIVMASSQGKFHSKFVDEITCLNGLYPSFLDELSIRGLVAREVGEAEVEEAAARNGVLRYLLFGCPQKYVKQVLEDGLGESGLEEKIRAESFGLDDTATLPFATSTDGSLTYPKPGIYELLLFLAFLPPETLSPAKGSTYNILYFPVSAPVAIIRLSVY